MLGFIMGVSGSFFGSVNDKTIVKFEKEILQVRFKQLFTLYSYNIYTRDGVKVIQGCYLLCDNGYLNWVILQCPSTTVTSLPLYNWSKRLESVRKDIECVFGRLKIRYSILKNRIRLHFKSVIDDVFRVCCILHNMLLLHDGWDTYIDDSNNWLHYNDLQDEDIDNLLLHNNVTTRKNNNVITDVVEDSVIEAQVGTVVFDGGNCGNETINTRSRDELRQLLVTHFEIAYEKKEIEWMSPRYQQ